MKETVMPMEDFEIKLHFPDDQSCAAFDKHIRNAQLKQEHLRIALPDSKFNSDNLSFSFLVRLFRHGHLDDVAAVARLIKSVIDLLPKKGPKEKKNQPREARPNRHLVLETSRGKFKITTNMSEREVRDLLHAVIFQQH